MSENKNIEHIGVISDIDNNVIKVDINVQSACASCHASAFCGVDSAGRTIEITKHNNDIYSVGDKVKVLIKESMGFKALFLGYVFPFIVMVVVLIIFISLDFSEGFSGLISILSLIPYYSVLYLFRKRIKKEFNFEIRKI